MLTNAPEYQEVFQKFLDWLKEIHSKFPQSEIKFIAHRSNFEFNFLQKYLSLINKEFPTYVSPEIIDSIDAATYILGSKDKSISKLCKIFEIETGADQHTAPRDVFLESEVLKFLFGYCYPEEDPSIRIVQWLNNPKMYDYKSKFFSKRISEIHKDCISFFSPDLLKHQVKLFGSPKTSHVDSRTMKKFKELFGEDFKEIKFKKELIKRKNGNILLNKFGTTRESSESFLKVAIKFRNLHFENVCFCDSCINSNRKYIKNIVKSLNESNNKKKGKKTESNEKNESDGGLKEKKRKNQTKNKNNKKKKNNEIIN